MPPKGRKGKKKVGKRTVALAKAALSHILSDEQDTSDNLKPLDVESKLAEMEEEMREKVERRCLTMMQQVPYDQESLARGLKKVKSGVPKRYGNMNLEEYCKTFGEDYEEVLFAALSPKEAEALLAQYGGGEDEDDGNDENDENDPGTIVKRQRGRPAAGKSTAARSKRNQVETETPSGRTRAAGRVLRSAAKSSKVDETPSVGRGGRRAAAGRPAASTRATRSKTARSSNALLVEEAVPQLFTKDGEKFSGQLFTQDGAKFYSPSGKLLISATPAVHLEVGVPQGGDVEALRKCLYVNGQSKKTAKAGTVTTTKTFARVRVFSRQASALTARVREQLRKGADPELTVYGNVEAITDRLIEETQTSMEESCEKLRTQFREAADKIRAKVRAALPDSNGAESAEGCKAAPVEEEARGDTARVKLTAARGPYDRATFEVVLEENGEARMVGRSSGKKFKQKGISLPKDEEVSTTHGKFENSEGRVTFTDLGSTNGTLVDGKEADEAKAYAVVDGSALEIGQSTFTLSITWDR